jgi:outer membrane protein assembly factor BamB
MPAPTLRTGRLFVGSMDGFFYALDAKTGGVAWKYESGYKIWNGTKYGGVRATPVVTGGLVVFGG